MSWNTSIRDSAAATALSLAKKLGSQFDIIDPANGTLTGAWGFIEKTSQSTHLRYGETDQFVFIVTIPRQKVGAVQFPWANINPGILIVFPSGAGVQYEVDLAEPDNEDLSMCSTIKFTCGRFGQTAEITGG